MRRSDRSCHWHDLGRYLSWKVSETIPTRQEVEYCWLVRIVRIVVAASTEKKKQGHARQSCERSGTFTTTQTESCTRTMSTHLLRAQIGHCEVRDDTRLQSVYVRTARGRCGWNEAFLDKHGPRKPAPVLTGEASADPAFVERDEIPVRTSAAASSSSSAGAQQGLSPRRWKQKPTFNWFSASIGRHP